MDEISQHGTLAETAEQVLVKRAESLARESIEESVTDQLSLLLYRIGEEWYAVKVNDVREIFQEYSITPIPCVPDYILGVVNVRGEILSVSDPAKMMRIGQIDLSGAEAPPAIVIEGGEVATAIVVDEIGDIVDVANDAVEPPVSIIDRAQADFISGSIHIGGTMVGLVHVQRILEPVVSAGRH